MAKSKESDLPEKPDDPSMHPTVEQWCLVIPLYVRKVINDASWLVGFYNDTHSFNCFCTECKKISVFRSQYVDPSQQVDFNTAYYPRTHELFFQCALDHDHELRFQFSYDMQGGLVKYGQLPSRKDLDNPHLRKYEKLLDSHYTDFSMAAGLASHDVGIGSFVYLRRIIESLVEKQHEVAKRTDKWDEVEFGKCRFEDKIKRIEAAVPDSLPKLITENRIVYKLLSKGIHQLDEAECLDAYPTLNRVIELILDEELEKREKDFKMKQLKTDLNDFNKKYNTE